MSSSSSLKAKNAAQARRIEEEAADEIAAAKSNVDFVRAKKVSKPRVKLTEEQKEAKKKQQEEEKKEKTLTPEQKALKRHKAADEAKYSHLWDVKSADPRARKSKTSADIRHDYMAHVEDINNAEHPYFFKGASLENLIRSILAEVGAQDPRDINIAPEGEEPEYLTNIRLGDGVKDLIGVLLEDFLINILGDLYTRYVSKISSDGILTPARLLTLLDMYINMGYKLEPQDIGNVAHDYRNHLLCLRLQRADTGYKTAQKRAAKEKGFVLENEKLQPLPVTTQRLIINEYKSYMRDDMNKTMNVFGDVQRGVDQSLARMENPKYKGDCDVDLEMHARWVAAKQKKAKEAAEASTTKKKAPAPRKRAAAASAKRDDEATEEDAAPVAKRAKASKKKDKMDETDE